jgi:hypothetical protein
MAIQGHIPAPARMALLAGVALRLGPQPLGLYGWHRLRLAAGLPQRALAGAAAQSAGALPPGALLGDATLPPPPALPPGWPESLRVALDRMPATAEHGPFRPDLPALGMDLFRPGDIRPVWEANRLGWLPQLVQAARLWPDAGYLALAESRLAEWAAANPPFQGPNWACGQEAALRALHLALALALADADRQPPAGARALLALHARRIRATGHYARAQDNNHAISEPAGLLVCGWLLEDAAMAAQGARHLVAAVRRLVAADGGFAQVSTGYHRLLLDVLSAVEWLRRRHGAPALAAPFAARAAAAAHWLARLVARDGGLPRLGHQDGSAFADLSLGGPADARGSVERAMLLFGGASAGFAADAGCAWMALPAARPAPRPGFWRATGSMGWQEAGARALLRCGPLRFRPGQADLLHLELWDGDRPVLTDAGTGAYNPPSAQDWWPAYFSGAAAHNTILFDGREPMRRLSRFLFGDWPALATLPDGAALRDRHGNRHQRRIRAEGRAWTIEDRVAGPFQQLALRWRLGPGRWQRTADGVVAVGIRIAVTADAPLRLSLQGGWQSPAYGQAERCPILVIQAAAPVTVLRTRLRLPDAGQPPPG